MRREVDDCESCPFFEVVYEGWRGIGIERCCHAAGRRFPAETTRPFGYAPPDWCPLRAGDVVVTLRRKDGG